VRRVNKPSLYLAAPLFTPAERALNLEIDSVLSKYFAVFLPQRDGYLIPGSRLNQRAFNEVSRKVFVSDVRAVESAEFVLAVLDGRTIDEGVAFELGIAFALKKECIGFRSDSRVLLPWGINPMIQGALSTSVSSLDELAQWATEVRKKGTMTSSVSKYLARR
jgi:nucleoside 2-deoxyribosyltransferase